MIDYGTITKVSPQMAMRRRPLNNFSQFTTETLNYSPSPHNLALVGQVKLLATGKYLPEILGLKPLNRVGLPQSSSSHFIFL
jgi:hypothetical protein